jgi:putative hydrolase of the HAD superfamily
MTIQAVLFDLDGTLLDRRETFRRHLELQVARHANLFGREDAVRYVAKLLELDENGTLDRGVFYDRVEAEFALPIGSSATLIADFETHFPETCAPLPHLHETLQALRGCRIKLAVVTNGRGLIQGRKVQRLGIRPFLDAVLISEEMGFRKPDPRIFRAALDQLRVEPTAAAFVGDNPDTDVLGARNIGLLSVWRRDDFWTKPASADHVIEDLAELPSLLGCHGRT